MANIQLHHISKFYDKNVKAVADFNLHIKDKEFIVLVGPSGCGKSTTLRMIAGLEDISEGELLIEGKRMNDVAPKDRQMAMVFQNYALYPHMSVFDNMAFGLKLRKVKKDEIKRRVEYAANSLGLEQYLERKPKALSGGQRQRVALGRAIVREANVFLMDEPLSNLDAKLRGQMRAEIVKLHRRLKTTTVYVTHDQIEAMTMATRMVVMKDGVIQQVGTPKDIYDYPVNKFVGEFIGSPSMNFLNGTLKSGYVEVGQLKIEVPRNKMAPLRTAGYVNQPIIIGVRPEYIYHNNDIKMEMNQTVIQTKVDVIELMGSESYLYADVINTSVIAKLDTKKDVIPGDSIQLILDMNYCHFFDVKTEQRISLEKNVEKRVLK